MGEKAAPARPSLEDVEKLVIRTLRLEEVGITEIDPDQALFGGGVGLDSIDALELALAISKEYGVTISSEDPNILQIFASLKNLTAHIQAHRSA